MQIVERSRGDRRRLARMIAIEGAWSLDRDTIRSVRRASWIVPGVQL